MVWAVPFQSAAVDTAQNVHFELIYSDFITDYFSKPVD